MKEILMPITVWAFYLAMMFLVVVFLSGCDQETALIMDSLVDELAEEPEAEPTFKIGHWVMIEGQEKLVFDSIDIALGHADTRKFLDEEISNIPIVGICREGNIGTWTAKVEHVMVFSNFRARAGVIDSLKTRGTLQRTSYKDNTNTFTMVGGPNHGEKTEWKVVAKEFIGTIPDDFREDKHPALDRDEEVRWHPEHGKLHISDYDFYLLIIYYYPFGSPNIPDCLDEFYSAAEDATENYNPNSHIRPDTLLETDRVSSFETWSPFVYPIFDNVDAALLSMKAYQKYVFRECGEGVPDERFVGILDSLSEVMCGMFEGSLVTGECEWVGGGHAPGRDMIYVVGFTSRDLRDRFIESVPNTFPDEVHPFGKEHWAWESYRVKKWINVIDDSIRWRYAYDNQGDRILAINLPNDFPVFCASLKPVGFGDAVCKAHNRGRL